jgi:hypothetical protein
MSAAPIMKLSKEEWIEKYGSGAMLIAEERRRHVSEEGWTPEHDDEHSRGRNRMGSFLLSG